jgi:hypothetical protein
MTTAHNAATVTHLLDAPESARRVGDACHTPTDNNDDDENDDNDDKVTHNSLDACGLDTRRTATLVCVEVFHIGAM